MCMRRIAFLMSVAAACNASATRLVVAFGSSDYIDTEAITNIAFSADSPQFITLGFFLDACGNNAELMFGNDVDADGMLSVDEEVLCVGWGGLWGAQELFKGTTTLHLIPGNCEGGWGYNSEHTNLAGLLTEFAKTNIFTDVELTASPLFRKFDNALLHQTNLISIAQTELNKVMGDGIPARSFAAGANPIGSAISEDYNYQGGTSPNGWPRREDEWWHSDITKVAYFYVYDFFNKLTK